MPKSKKKKQIRDTKASKIATAYDKRKISRSKAFKKLKALGYSTDAIRANLGDLD